MLSTRGPRPRAAVRARSVRRPGRAIAAAISITCLVGGPRAVSAQEAPPLPQPLTLEAALAYAADHYPRLRVAVEDVAAAAVGIDVARTAYLPRLEALWQVNRGTVNNITGPLLPQSIVPGISGPPQADASARSVFGSAAGALLSWEPLDFGSRSASVREAEAAVARARAREGLTRLDVQQAVAGAYLDAVAARQAVVVADADVARREVLVRATRALADAQLRPGAEASRAEAERAAAQTRAVQARQAVALADATLTRILGAPDLPAALDATALLTRMPADAEAAVPPAGHPWLNVQQAAIDVAHAHEAVLAVTNRPRVFVQTSAAARGSGAQPDGRLTGGTDGLGFDRVNWAAGVQVVVPNLFDLATTRARRRAAVATTRAETARLDDDRLALTAERRRAEAMLQAARDVARVTPVQLDAARLSETQARARYDAGLAGIAEVADTQALLAAAEFQEAAAHLQVWRAVLAQAMAAGTIESFVARLRSPE